MSKKMTGFILIAFLLFSIFALPACTMERRPGPTNPAPDNEGAPQLIPNTDQFNGTDESPRTEMNQETTLANQLADKIKTSVDEVNSATVVVSGNQAWVGVNLKAGAGARLAENTKQRIIQIVKMQDDKITRVYVTADADIVTRLKSIADKITTENPASAFMDELNDITTRIMPTVQ